MLKRNFRKDSGQQFGAAIDKTSAHFWPTTEMVSSEHLKSNSLQESSASVTQMIVGGDAQSE